MPFEAWSSSDIGASTTKLYWKESRPHPDGCRLDTYMTVNRRPLSGFSALSTNHVATKHSQPFAPCEAYQ